MNEELEKKIDEAVGKKQYGRKELFRADDVSSVGWFSNGKLVNCSATRYDKFNGYENIRIFNLDQAERLAGAVQEIIDCFKENKN